jgi:hypothetical protein
MFGLPEVRIRLRDASVLRRMPPAKGGSLRIQQVTLTLLLGGERVELSAGRSYLLLLLLLLRRYPHVPSAGFAEFRAGRQHHCSSQVNPRVRAT